MVKKSWRKFYHLSLKKVYEINKTTKKTRQIVEKSDLEDGDTQTLAIHKITGTQSLRDTLEFKK